MSDSISHVSTTFASSQRATTRQPPRRDFGPGDYVRSIDNIPTREMSVWEGLRSLRGAPGTKVSVTIIRGNAADPHVVELTRESLGPSDVNGQIAAPGVGYLRIAAVGPSTAEQVKKEVGDLTKSGAAKVVVDVRRTSGGALEDGLAVARLFVGRGVLAMREARGLEKQTIAAATGDGSIALPAVPPDRYGNIRCGGAIRGRAVRQSARRADWRENDRPRCRTETDQASRRQRAVAVHGALSHTCGYSASRERTRAGGPGRRAGRGIRTTCSNHGRSARESPRAAGSKGRRLACRRLTLLHTVAYNGTSFA